ncbi:protease complex subunit PrcB family protein [Actinomadura chokoriensis]|uniref:Protease complex subunit PrcB family protein n=1 Tax=Actinomadura chokoriensis TaxID=454156 RepID=A0ABV4R0I1_9ACTN
MEDSPSRDISFQTLIQEQSSGLEDPVHLVIRDQNSWTEIWRLKATTTPIPPPPHVDWSTTMVILVALGARSAFNYDVEIDRITQRGGIFTVHAVETLPGCVTFDAFSHPVHAVTTARFDGKVDVTIEQRQTVCEDCTCELAQYRDRPPPARSE